MTRELDGLVGNYCYKGIEAAFLRNKKPASMNCTPKVGHQPNLWGVLHVEVHRSIQARSCTEVFIKADRGAVLGCPVRPGPRDGASLGIPVSSVWRGGAAQEVQSLAFVPLWFVAPEKSVYLVAAISQLVEDDGACTRRNVIFEALTHVCPAGFSPNFCGIDLSSFPLTKTSTHDTLII